MKKAIKKVGPAPKGKLFYVLLGLLVFFIIVPMLLTLLMSQRMLSSSHDNLQYLLAAAQETQLNIVQNENPGRNHATRLVELRKFPLLDELGGRDDLDYGEDIARAEEILLSLTPDSAYGHITTYMHFIKSDYLIDSSQLGRNAIGDAPQEIFDGYTGMDTNDTGFSRTFLRGGTYGEENACSIHTSVVFPGVVFIFRIDLNDNSSRPDRSLSEDFTAGLKDVETSYYDSYGNARVTGKNHMLAYQYNYYSLGPDSDNYFSFKYNGNSYICYYVFNEYNQTKYAVFFRDEVTEGLRTMSGLLWISGALVIIACLICAVLYARRAYAPMDSLISRLPKKNGDGDEPLLRDDFQVLNEAVDSLDDRLAENSRLLRRFFMLRLLRGQGTGMLEDYRDEWFSPDSGCAFAAAALHIDEVDEAARLDESWLEGAVTADLKANDFDVRAVMDGDFLYILFKLPQKSEKPELSAVCRRLQRGVNGCCVSVFVSAVHPSVRDIHRCYSETMALYDYYTSHDIIGVVADFGDLPKSSRPEGTSLPDYGQLHKLSDCITALSAADALSAFDELVSQFKQSAGRDIASGDMKYDMLINTIALSFYDISVPGDIGKNLIQQCVDRLRDAGDAGSLRDVLRECLDTLARKNDVHDLKQRRFEEIRDYVLENYTNPGMDSASISEYFKTSPSTITRLFKKYNNTGFLEYVHQLRVVKATELLESANLSVAEIAALVGYTNAVTMNRTFKTYAKTTPGMIRKLTQP